MYIGHYVFVAEPVTTILKLIYIAVVRNGGLIRV